LHGWPYDIYSYVDVAPLLAAKGYRVIVPYLRGYGTTRFLSSETVRNGQPSAVALDITALMDALKTEKATIAGFDWGARTANIIAALWPERCKALVSVSGYLIGSQAAAKGPLPPQAELQWWYQYYFATERGREGYDKLLVAGFQKGSDPPATSRIEQQVPDRDIERRGKHPAMQGAHRIRARRRITESSHRAHDCRFRHAGACRHAPA
jgi:pimeloyl-ACP methyl ester carboxylesterase